MAAGFVLSQDSDGMCDQGFLLLEEQFVTLSLFIFFCLSPAVWRLLDAHDEESDCCLRGSMSAAVCQRGGGEEGSEGGATVCGHRSWDHLLCCRDL